MQTQRLFDHVWYQRIVSLYPRHQLGIGQKLVNDRENRASRSLIASDHQLMPDGHQGPIRQSLAIMFHMNKPAVQAVRRIFTELANVAIEELLHFDHDVGAFQLPLWCESRVCALDRDVRPLTDSAPILAIEAQLVNDDVKRQHVGELPGELDLALRNKAVDEFVDDFVDLRLK
jgi:hypothetical protein